jgi:hypothetical protein
MFSIKNIFKENDLFENIFRRKPFYVEVNEALMFRESYREFVVGHFL